MQKKYFVGGSFIDKKKIKKIFTKYIQLPPTYRASEKDQRNCGK
jgi:hypothetical protein